MSIPTSAPKTSFELEKTWAQLVRQDRSLQSLAQYMRAIPVSSYPSLLQNMLSEEMVGEIARVLRDYYQPYVLPMSLLLLLSLSPPLFSFLTLICLDPIPVSSYPSLLQNMLSEEMVGEIARVLRDYYQPYVRVSVSSHSPFFLSARCFSTPLLCLSFCLVMSWCG